MVKVLVWSVALYKSKSWTLRSDGIENKKLSYCWETVRRESMPKVAEMDVEMTS